MTPLNPMAQWLEKFRARHNLNAPVAEDEHVARERAEAAAAYVNAHVPARYADAAPTVPAVDTWLADMIRLAVRDSQQRGLRAASVHRGDSLLLSGPTGVGKTHEVYGAMRALSLFGIHTPWVVTSAADVYARMRPRPGVDSEKEFHHFVDAPVLAIDDIGAAKNTEWVEEVNFRLVNHRYESGLPTIFTSNLTPRQMRELLGDRIASRITGMTTRVPMTGDDRRLP